MKGGMNRMNEPTESEILMLGVGTKEVASLKPAKVKIVDVKTVKVGDKGNKKVCLSIKHPDREELVEISSVKIETKGKLEFSGLWVNLDDDNLLRKGSVLARTLEFFNVSSALQLRGKEVDTLQDEKGYLAIKAY